MFGSFLTQWTIRLALVCLVAYLAGRLLGYGDSTNQTPVERNMFAALRWIWTIGCVLFVTHVACAFQFTHHWSHTHAWDHTAAETQRMLGFSFGNGIYFSYLFLLLWVTDVACLWLAVQRPGWVLAPVYLFLFFIALNGAIVFEEGPTRPVGIVILVALAPVLGWFAWRQSRVRFGSKTDNGRVSAEVEA